MGLSYSWVHSVNYHMVQVAKPINWFQPQSLLDNCIYDIPTWIHASEHVHRYIAIMVMLITYIFAFSTIHLDHQQVNCWPRMGYKQTQVVLGGTQ
jgi:hypothetical protein